MSERKSRYSSDLVLVKVSDECVQPDCGLFVGYFAVKVHLD